MKHFLEILRNTERRDGPKSDWAAALVPVFSNTLRLKEGRINCDGTHCLWIAAWKPVVQHFDTRHAASFSNWMSSVRVKSDSGSPPTQYTWQ